MAKNFYQKVYSMYEQNNKWINNRSKNVQTKNKRKIERIQDIKGLIQMYLALNKGK